MPISFFITMAVGIVAAVVIVFLGHRSQKRELAELKKWRKERERKAADEN